MNARVPGELLEYGHTHNQVTFTELNHLQNITVLYLKNVLLGRRIFYAKQINRIRDFGLDLRFGLLIYF